jgi:ribonuclease P protein component
MTTPAGEGFPKAARVRRRREYLALGRTARRRHAAHFVVLTRARAGAARLGVTVSRKVGIAVVRNRVKRHVREIFRRHPERLLPAHDLIVIAKPGAGDLAAIDVARELAAALAVGDPPRTRRA